MMNRSTVCELFPFQHSDKTANLMNALDNARKQPKKMRKVDFSQSARSTTSSVGGSEEPR